MDVVILESLNSLAGRSTFFDRSLNHMAGSALFKGLPPMLLFWWMWAISSEGARTRLQLAATLGVAVIAIAVGRLLALVLPFTLRPIHEPSITIAVPIGMSEQTLEGWSAMPSDHAVLFFAIATCFFLIHRLAGILAYLHAAVVVSLPRVVLGLHWPSDIAAGAVIGILVGLICLAPLTRAAATISGTSVPRWTRALLYPVLFFVTFQTATMFTSLRDLMSAVADAASL